MGEDRVVRVSAYEDALELRRPAGWFRFGDHSNPRTETPELEFSTETDSRGAPLWERPVGRGPVE